MSICGKVPGGWRQRRQLNSKSSTNAPIFEYVLLSFTLPGFPSASKKSCIFQRSSGSSFIETLASIIFCQKVSISGESGNMQDNPTIAIGSNGPCSIPFNVDESDSAILSHPHSIMFEGTMVIEYPASTWMH